MKKLLASLLVAAFLAAGLYANHKPVAASEPRSWKIEALDQSAIDGLDVKFDRLVGEVARVCSVTPEQSRAVLDAGMRLELEWEAVLRQIKASHGIPESISVVRSGSYWVERR